VLKWRAAPGELEDRVPLSFFGAKGRAVDNVTQLVRRRSFEPREVKPQRRPRVFLLGDMRAEAVDGGNMLPHLRKSQALLAYLCLADGRRLARSRVAGVIWDGVPESNARESLRHAMFDLQRLSWSLERDHETARLDLRDVWIDAVDTPAPPDQLLRSLHGLSSSFDAWIAAERARYEEHWRLDLVRELEDRVAQKASPDLRAESARKLLNVVESDEGALRHLMVSLVDLGDSPSAIREFERFRMMLEKSYLLFPSEQTVTLAEAIRLRSRPKAERVPMPAAPRSGMTIRGPSGTAEQVGAERYVEPSIAVLPFRNLSTDRRHAFVADGLVEDLIETISRVPSFLVVSRLSTAAFRQYDRSPREIGDAFGVRYALSGSVRIIGDRLRLMVELLDTSDDLPLWRSRFDERFSDLLEMQSRVAEKVVRTVAPNVWSSELTRAAGKRREDQTAYDLFLRAQDCMHRPSRVEFETAEKLLKQALSHQPNHARLLAWLAHWYVLRVGQGYSADPATDTALAEEYAARAIECDVSEPLALALQGHIAAYLRKDFRQALASFEAALEVNPNAPRSWLWRAYTHSWLVEGERAVADINRAMTLSPYDPMMFLYSGCATIAYIAAEQFGRAIEFSWRCVRENPNYTTGYKSLIVALVLSGREAEAQVPAHQLRLREPSFTLDNFRRHSPAYAGPRGELYYRAFAAGGIQAS